MQIAKLKAVDSCKVSCGSKQNAIDRFRMMRKLYSIVKILATLKKSSGIGPDEGICVTVDCGGYFGAAVSGSNALKPDFQSVIQPLFAYFEIVKFLTCTNHGTT